MFMILFYPKKNSNKYFKPILCSHSLKRYCPKVAFEIKVNKVSQINGKRTGRTESPSGAFLQL